MSLDTEHNIHSIVSTIKEHYNVNHVKIDDLINMQDENRDKMFQSLTKFIQKEFQPSELALIVIETIYLSFQSLKYSTPVFFITELGLSVPSRFEELKKSLS